jgi:hypothetical protein
MDHALCNKCSHTFCKAFLTIPSLDMGHVATEAIAKYAGSDTPFMIAFPWTHVPGAPNPLNDCEKGSKRLIHEEDSNTICGNYKSATLIPQRALCRRYLDTSYLWCYLFRHRCRQMPLSLYMQAFHSPLSASTCPREHKRSLLFKSVIHIKAMKNLTFSIYLSFNLLDLSCHNRELCMLIFRSEV